MVALKKKPKARKCRSSHNQPHYTCGEGSVIRRRSEKKIEDIIGEDQFGFKNGKGTRDAIGMLRIISEQTLDIGEEICVCCIDWQKAFDRVKWTKLMKILKKTGIDWHERKLISKLYTNQSVKVWLYQGVIKSVKTGRGVRQGCCLSPLLFNLHSKYFTQEALEGLGDFKVGGQIISMLRYADDLVLLAKEETILQCMINNLIEVGRSYGMKINVEKN
jgi:retron-type reverse transcriptase